MSLLALDTALDACSAAVRLANGQLVARSEIIGRGHAERLMPLVEAVMAEAGVRPADLSRVVVTVGPGSFTGIRVGLAAARGLALALRIPAVGVSTLDALAFGTQGLVAAAIDARRGELYAGLYQDGRPLGAPRAIAAAALAAEAAQIERVVGSGAQVLAEALATAGRPAPAVGAIPAPDIASVAQLGADAATPDHPPKPLYLRAPDAKPQDAFRVARA